jgi:minimal PKS acyl carrier protein
VTFSIHDLMDLLVAHVGLPAASRTDDPAKTFADVGLDSLAFLQFQTELDGRYGFELPSDRVQDYTFGDIVAFVSSQLAGAA